MTAHPSIHRSIHPSIHPSIIHQPMTGSARRPAREIAASAGIRSAASAIDTIPTYLPWCGDHHAALSTLHAPSLLTSLSLTSPSPSSHPPLALSTHLNSTRLVVSGPQGCNSCWRNMAAGLTLRPAASSPRPIDRCLPCPLLVPVTLYPSYTTRHYSPSTPTTHYALRTTYALSPRTPTDGTIDRLGSDSA